MEQLSTKVAVIEQCLAVQRRELDEALHAKRIQCRAVTSWTARLIYFAVAICLRKPAARFGEFWNVGLLITGLTLTIAVSILLTEVLFGFPEWASLVLLVGTMTSTFGTLLALLKIPSHAHIRDLLERAKNTRRISATSLRDVKARIALMRREISRLETERNDVLNSERYQQEQLLEKMRERRESLSQCNWKALRGIEFENFLREVFLALGAQVDLTKTSCDRGVDLVVTINGKKIAIQAKGFADSVGSSAVQEAVAGRKPYNCDVCAVITNSRFARQAIELAAFNECVMIDGDKLSSLILRGDPFGLAIAGDKAKR